ncbi:nitrous oxide reductase family maturation protein NosD [Flavihumibacter profundi]|uniref:nitrous oxide reductase family maturation protein NosD n=1 Tax=Flavihumibacter profundi TaxID=2716883 RepID=UPI001CC56B07|nr:nitrous oxide reductase family maturation protein NosD [Flavihumibacter profundi]MBZ5857107.1 nitrous oxide reductase family maturation protein NosD [Flavihumibacter profundi]
MTLHFKSILIFWGLLFCTIARAATITVYPNQTINAAVQQAKPGDVIRVMPGTYREKGIIINKPIILIGVDHPVLEGEHKYEILTIISNNVIVQGFTIQHSGYSSMDELAAIRLKNVSHVSIRNNHLLNNFFGIYCQHADSCVISGNQIESDGTSELESGNGIHGWKCDHLIIANNSITGHRDGIYFEFVTNTLIFHNNSFKNIRYGLHFMFSHSDTYVKNIFSNNGAGVAVMYSHKVIMHQNEFRENWGSSAYGLLMKEITDSHAEGNLFYRNTSAVYMEGSNRIHIIHNRFLHNGNAIKLQASCEDNIIEQNNFSGNSFDVSTNGSLVLNRFSKNYWDKYEGYDLNKNGIGDVPFRPLSIYTLIVERNATAMMLFRSPIVNLLERAEKILPGITPESLKDDEPLMKPLPL